MERNEIRSNQCEAPLARLDSVRAEQKHNIGLAGN